MSLSDTTADGDEIGARRREFALLSLSLLMKKPVCQRKPTDRKYVRAEGTGSLGKGGICIKTESTALKSLRASKPWY